MRSTVRFPTVLKLGLALTLVLPGIAGSAWARPHGPKKSAKAISSTDDAVQKKKSAQEISSTDDALQKQMDWENKILGPNTEKKIDLAKIQKLQAEETARREKQEKIDKVEKERRDRESERTAAAQRNVHAPSSRDMPEVEEAPPPPPKVEKHDDAFVDKLLKDKGTTKKKSAAATNDEVDQLLNATKPDKPTGVAAKNKGGKVDTVDQLLATADKEPTIKTTTKRPNVTDEPVSAEAAAREAAMKAIAAAQAKADEERGRNRKPIVPDAAMLRGRAEANARANPPSRQDASAPTRANWNDPFAGEGSSDGAPPTSRRSKVTTTVRPPSPPAEMDVESTPAPRRSSARPGSPGWKDPFDAGEGVPAPRARPGKSAPAGKSKHPANWKDPFA